MADETRQHLEDVREAHTRRLHILEEQAALYGIAAPPHILIEIEDLRGKIQDINRQLAELATTQPAGSGLPRPAPRPRQQIPADEETAPVPPDGQSRREQAELLGLRESLANGNVSAFVGAGLSVGAGLPGWYTLISELAQRIGYELPPAKWATGDALIDAAQAYLNQRGLHDLVAFLKERLDTTGRSPTAAHLALARLPISLVLTANYDDLLERAYRDVGKRVRVVVRDTDIPFMDRQPGAVNLVKLYGDLNQPDTIVLARQQYEAFFLQHPQMVKLLETELGRADMLYLGWSHTDPHFGLVFGELLNRFGPFMRPGYAVMFEMTEDRQRELARKHIRPVQLPPGADRTTALAAWLAGLGGF